MTPTERRNSQIARLRSDAAERYTGDVLTHLLGEIGFVERVWSTLDHEPSTGKGASPDERRAAGKLLFVRTALRDRDRPYETDEAASDRQARRQVAMTRLQAERMARPPSPPAVRTVQCVVAGMTVSGGAGDQDAGWTLELEIEEKPGRAPAQMSLFGDAS